MSRQYLFGYLVGPYSGLGTLRNSLIDKIFLEGVESEDPLRRVCVEYP